MNAIRRLKYRLIQLHYTIPGDGESSGSTIKVAAFGKHFGQIFLRKEDEYYVVEDLEKQGMWAQDSLASSAE